MHINPDHFLETPEGRVHTPERNVEAWRQCHIAFDTALEAAASDTVLYLLVGPQGAGKSTWARQTMIDHPNAIIFDAILVKKAEREPLLNAANQHQIPTVAVWFQAPLEVCLAQNAARPTDEIVPERAIRNVFAALEPPTCAEGFERVIEIHP
jgi:predicted kinase